jgi:DNA-binding protein HU-beta
MANIKEMSMLTKSDISNRVAEKCSTRKGETSQIVDAVIDEIAAAIAGGDGVRLPGLGTFGVKDYAARKGINPATGQPVNIPAGKKVTFKAASDLKGKL